LPSGGSEKNRGSEGASIGARVRAARGRLGWTRESLAHHSDLSWSAIEQIESGRRRNTRPDTLKALSKALGVTIDYLVSGESAAPMFNHQLLMYRDDDTFVDGAAPFLTDGMERDEALLAITTKRKFGLLKQQLGRSSDQVEFMAAETWYTSPVAAMKAYRSFLDDKLARGVPWARIVGDPDWPGGSEREISAWTQYESLVNLAFAPSPVTILCTYDERSVHPDIVHTAQLTHPQIVEGPEMSDNPMYRDPSEFFFGDGPIDGRN
jgi:transcriptional regulator with XRE-family HTH domain